MGRKRRVETVLLQKKNQLANDSPHPTELKEKDRYNGSEEWQHSTAIGLIYMWAVDRQILNKVHL